MLGITSGMLLSSIANAATVPLTPTPKCGDLKYNLPKTDSWKCYDKYFTCPLDPNYIKCDRMAKVGDIKYTKSSTANKGWLLCNGATYDATKYTELKNLIGQKFSPRGNSGYLLPNYIGVFLKGASDPTNLRYTLIPQELLKHGHKISGTLSQIECKYSSSLSFIIYQGSGKEFNILQFYKADDKINTKTTTFTVNEYTGGAYVCPYRVVLYPYIYAGKPATK